MTGQPSVDGLIARLEAATKGTRDLDQEIEIAMNPENVDVYRCGRYSTSLDAALMLVPEGSSVMLDINPGEACCTVHDSSGHVSEPAAVSKTAPLALCIAALRARQIAPHNG